MKPLLGIRWVPFFLLAVGFPERHTACAYYFHKVGHPLEPRNFLSTSHSTAAMFQASSWPRW